MGFVHHLEICSDYLSEIIYTVIPRLKKIIRPGITFVSRNLLWPKRDFP